MAFPGRQVYKPFAGISNGKYRAHLGDNNGLLG